MAERKKEINGITFSVAPFMALEGFKLKATLVRTFGPALGELLGGLNLSSGRPVPITEMAINAAPIAAGIEKLMCTLDDNTVEALLKRLLTNVIANFKDEDGKDHSVAFMTDFNTSFQLVFSQKLFTVYSVIGFVLEVNYPDFFDRVKGIGQRIQTTFTSAMGTDTSKSDQSSSEMSES